MYNLRRGGSRRTVNIWPGFVDALATLLLVVIFVLLVFIVAQFYLSNALSGRDQALARLEEEVAELSELLALERSANADLRLSVAGLSSELQSSLEDRDALRNQLTNLQSERDDLSNQLFASREELSPLNDRLAALEAEGEGREAVIAQLEEETQNQAQITARLEAQLKDAFATIEADKEKIEAQLAELALLRELRDSLREEVAALTARLTGAEEEAEALRSSLEAANETVEVSEAKIRAQVSELAILRDLREQLRKEVAALESKIQAALDAKALTEEELAEQRRLNEETAASLAQQETLYADQVKLTEEAQAQVLLLNQQLAALRRQLAQLNAALEASETLNEEQEAQIIDLGKRLNAALATKVQELARYRSEFFGRLREILGERDDIRIVGDRFVFQSEVLFETAEAEIGAEGKEQLATLATALKEIAAEIPEEIEWILRVDGHTDKRPIRTPEFQSNWELSTARALSVVNFLIEQGIPPNRLAATGFGEFQPIESGEDAAALSRNRRIELKLTER
ncbi:peptidoglycan -binding protein [Limibacillus halophilus]